MSCFPSSYFLPRPVKDALVISKTDLLARLFVEQRPQRRVLIVDLEIGILVGWRNFIRSEEESIWILVHEVGGRPDCFGTRYNVLRYLIPGDIEVDVTEFRVLQNICKVSCMISNGPDHSSH